MSCPGSVARNNVFPALCMVGRQQYHQIGLPAGSTALSGNRAAAFRTAEHDFGGIVCGRKVGQWLDITNFQKDPMGIQLLWRWHIAAVISQV